MRKNKAIIFDVDCVLLDFYSGFAKIASNALHKEVTQQKIAYDLLDRYSITKDELSYIFKVMHKKFDNVPLLEDADKAFKMFKDENYKIHIITAIPEECMEMRLKNLGLYDMLPDTIDCVGNNSKYDAIRKYNAQAFVDDRIQNLSEVKNVVPHRIWINNGDDQVGYEDKHNHITDESENVMLWAKRTHLLEVNIQNKIDNIKPKQKFKIA